MTKKPIKSIAQTIETLRAQISAQPEAAAYIAANDTLFKDLESRWGSGFAQWLVDGLGKADQPRS